jgi:REP element-mobilizing transposase RayT
MIKDQHRFKDMYRVESDRLKDWDYAGTAWYFVTICIRNNKPFFGYIIDDEVCLSPLGLIVEEEWKRTAQIRPSVFLDEFVIMPNHLHAIIQFRKAHPVKTESVETHSCASLHGPSLRRPPRSLGSLIAGFKSAVTKRIRGTGRHDFVWQRGYHDHIIRDDGDLRRIRHYIRLNPLKWSLDPYNPLTKRPSPIAKS